MAFNDIIQVEIDACIGKTNAECEQCILKCFDMISDYIEKKYENSREVLQYCIGQLERKNDVAVAVLIHLAVENIKFLARYFSKEKTPPIDYFNIEWEVEEIKSILAKIAPLMEGRNDMSAPNIAIGDALSEIERRKIVSYILEAFANYSLKLEWSKDEIENNVSLLIILYSICKKDNVMLIFLNGYYNICDLLNYSGNPQDARDLAENLLMVGYNEGLEIEAYLGVSRTYTHNNPLAGLLYFNLSLSFAIKKGDTISQRVAFEFLWQLLKLMRNSKYLSISEADEILTIFNGLNCSEYEMLSIFNTYFLLKFLKGDASIVDEVSDFLNAKREAIFKNMNHSVMPWMNLFMIMRKYHPGKDFATIAYYEKIMLPIVKENGNQVLIDFYSENGNLVGDLRKRIARLETTRNPSDYGHDSQFVQLEAKKVITMAAKGKIPNDYLLAMRCRADYTFVKDDIPTSGVFRQFEIDESKEDALSSNLISINILQKYLKSLEDTIVLIGKGEDSYYQFSLRNDSYDFQKLDSLSGVNFEQLHTNVISKQVYEKIIKDRYGSYTKSVQDFEDEDEIIRQAVNKCILTVGDATRILLVKDMEMGALPHHLFIDDASGDFEGKIKAMANVLSPEVLLKTNQKNVLSSSFSCSYWSPYNSEITFPSIRNKLDDVISCYGISVSDEDTPATPLSSDINIVCAHGGHDISDTHWFYAGGRPIINTDRIIGTGALLILFVCHSGSIAYKDYDNTMHTLIKKCIRMGYSSVVAPMWSLPTEILHTWLNTFLQKMSQGEYIIDAVFEANMAVKIEFIAASAWACLHLFGNPYLRIDKPSDKGIE